MFIVETKLTPEAEKVLKRVKKFIGHIPPHFELFATLNLKRFEMFLNEIFYLSMHKSIQPDFFALLRFYIATQENFNYCHHFNKALLIRLGYEKMQLKSFISSKEIPLDAKHQELFLATLEALYQPETFTLTNIEHLKSIGWSDADIYDAIDHGAFLFKFSKILKAYSK